MIALKKQFWMIRILAVTLIGNFSFQHAHYFEQAPYYGPLGSTTYQRGKISVQAQYMSRADCKTYFGKDLIALGYRPVVCTVMNISNAQYVLRKDGIKLPLVPEKTIISLLRCSIMPFALAAAVSGVRVFKPGLLNMACLAAGAYFNRTVGNNMRTYCLSEHESYSVPPYQQRTFFFFVPEAEMVNQFELSYLDTGSRNYECITIDLLKTVREKNYFIPSCYIID
jgi:hypothetical protein